MSNGKTHLTVGKLSAIGFALAEAYARHGGDAIASFFGVDWSLVAGGIFGAVWLSPDVDMNPVKYGYKTAPLKVWGPFSFIWRPFQAKHRGITHVPVMGSLLMQSYLALICISIYLLICEVREIPRISFDEAIAIVQPYRQEIFRFSLMSTLQQVVHLILDVKPRSIIRYRRRRRY